MDDLVESLLRGAVDLHCHSSPSIMDRRLDHLEAMREAAEAGFEAVLIKDHYYSGVPVAALLNRQYGELGVRMFSGVPLNNQSGGINPHAVDHGIKLGGRIVWMPTVHAGNHLEHQRHAKPGEEFPPRGLLHLPPEPVYFMDAKGALTDATKSVLDLIAQGDIVLSAGHIHISEIWPLFEEARRRGVKRLLVNHPTYVVGASLKDLRDLARFGAYLEHSLCMWVGAPTDIVFEPDDLRNYIDAAGVDRTILGSDLGQAWNCSPVEGFRRTIRILIGLGYGEVDIRQMTSFNARALIGLT